MDVLFLLLLCTSSKDSDYQSHVTHTRDAECWIILNTDYLKHITVTHAAVTETCTDADQNLCWVKTKGSCFLSLLLI